jgi:hypothetical protein
MFITDAVLNGLPPHIAQVVAGHRDINVTYYRNRQPRNACPNNGILSRNMAATSLHDHVQSMALEILRRMAVTQQLVRIPATQLAACRLTVTELDKLCSFTSAPKADYLDLNWWPIALKRIGELPVAGHSGVAVLGHAFGGTREVNPAYRDHPDTVWWHPVTALEPDAVEQIAGALRVLTPEAVRAAVPPTPGEAEALLGSELRGVDNLADRLAHQFTLLRDFYDEAARRHLAVVFWWD